MDTYVVLRRGGWRTPEELEAAADRSKVTGAGMPDEVRWVRSYAIVEEDGSLGTVCIYEATDPEALRRHAADADLPVIEIRRVAQTLIAGEDPAGVVVAA
ncbi:MAG: nickel-binding protein [Thermoleophilia bacterium]